MPQSLKVRAEMALSQSEILLNAHQLGRITVVVDGNKVSLVGDVTSYFIRKTASDAIARVLSSDELHVNNLQVIERK